MLFIPKLLSTDKTAIGSMDEINAPNISESTIGMLLFSKHEPLYTINAVANEQNTVPNNVYIKIGMQWRTNAFLFILIAASNTVFTKLLAVLCTIFTKYLPIGDNITLRNSFSSNPCGTKSKQTPPKTKFKWENNHRRTIIKNLLATMIQPEASGKHLIKYLIKLLTKQLSTIMIITPNSNSSFKSSFWTSLTFLLI